MKCILTLVSLLTMGVSLKAQLAPQPFLPPPRLQEKTGIESQNLLASRAANAGECNPDGDITVGSNTVTVNLNVRYLPNTMRNPGDTMATPPVPPHMDNVQLRSYGGCLTGPLIEVKPGNTLRINLHNELSTKDPSCPGGPDSKTDPGCFNTINLHYHGLHVSPSGNSDNVLLNIAPSSKFEYEVNIPEDHPAGTFWYHAHRHGSTSLQVASGASGVLIVKGTRPYKGGDPGDVDTILHDAAGKPFAEQVFLFQQIPYGCFIDEASGTPYQQLITDTGLMTDKVSQKGAWICPKTYMDPNGKTYPVTAGVVENFGVQLASPTVWDYSQRFTSINGAVQPVLKSVAAGEIQRWRMIHGGIHDTVNVQVVRMVPAADMQLTAMAFTGALLGTPKEQEKELEQICPVLLPDGKPTGGIVPQFELASDGLTQTHLRKIGADLEKTKGITSNFLQPGYRSDILIAFPSEGTYCVLNEAAPADERPTNGGGGGQGPNTTQLLATVVVSGGKPVTGDLQAYIEQALYNGNKSTPDLPAAALAGLKTGDLTPWSPKFNLGVPSNATHPLPVEFKISADTKGNVGFFVNNASYDPDRVDQTRQVNTTDDWVLTAVGGGGIPAEPHIFHIHVNPFEVVDVTSLATGASIFGPRGECLVTEAGLANQYCGMWHKFKDTVFVQNGYKVLIRTKYDRYIGEFVIHCHILDHEDSGMMANVEIVPDASAPGGGLGMPGMKHTNPQTGKK
jgi:FtsP/CotA-like multicopper oxidase with cupredoxin domain